MLGISAQVIDQLSEFQSNDTSEEGYFVLNILLHLICAAYLLQDSQKGHQIRLLVLRQIQLLNQVEELHRVFKRQ